MHYDMYSELSSENNNEKQDKMTHQLKRKKDFSKRAFDNIMG